MVNNVIWHVKGAYGLSERDLFFFNGHIVAHQQAVQFFKEVFHGSTKPYTAPVVL